MLKKEGKWNDTERTNNKSCTNLHLQINMCLSLPTFLIALPDFKFLFHFLQKNGKNIKSSWWYWCDVYYSNNKISFWNHTIIVRNSELRGRNHCGKLHLHYEHHLGFKYLKTCLAVERPHWGFRASSQVKQYTLYNAFHKTKSTLS